MGHVAVVEQVGRHDSYIVASQQHLLNAADGYEWTRISAGFPADTWQPWPSLFIHFPITRLPPRLSAAAACGRAGTGWAHSSRYLPASPPGGALLSLI